MTKNLSEQVKRRRTFAIIAHPDAGKTTLTEKLLLFGGAIQMAGAVKARGEERRARSDWLKVERERGISVASSVMSYEYENCFIVYPQIKWNSKQMAEPIGKRVPEGFVYTSDNNGDWLSVDEIGERVANMLNNHE